ncbi:hypothetical protein [Streptacidiphilus jiangxiensis]|uniref:Uncharacterized protein n=1 Tax=Streptacidiphilus jiangxiensis TaxID=235985 RepID=A0A1H7VWP9_STRJI|nr:hypothetical protein [Streptacidiphilus jiangxiensis]SEM13484.1 hypothetical protein SAMN05414137_11943 [Streptacidiphilus jiangxiensis]
MHLHLGAGRTALLFMLVAFVLTFAVTRLIVRMIRSGRGPFGNVAVGEVHVHHLVPGIFLLLISGVVEFLAVPNGLLRSCLAAAFGVGAALTLDEFALWLHLSDVYWAEEGRTSVDTVVGVAALGAIGLLVSNPFARQPGEGTWFFFSFILLNSALSVVAALKGRYFLGVAGVLLPFLALWGALRLGYPGSPWFRRFYGEGSTKRARSERRASRRRLSDRFKALVSGLPERR